MLQQHICAAAAKPKFVYDWSPENLDLPQLPIPPLADTCARFKEMLEPLMDGAELTAAFAAVDEFGGKEGPEFNTDLTRRNQNSPNTSYVKPFWDRMYLGGRYPVPINSNPSSLAMHPPVFIYSSRQHFGHIVRSH